MIKFWPKAQSAGSFFYNNRKIIQDHNNTLLLLLLLLLLLEPASQAQMEETKFCHKLLSQPHKHLLHVKLKNKLRVATND